MTVRVTRSFEFGVPPERVWAFIEDPENRAAAISVVDRFDVTGDGEVTWHVRLPIPVINQTIAVRTRDVDVDPPRHVKFVGRSSAMNVTGEHTVEPTDGGSRLVNEFVVDGRFPGVERFFSRNLDSELDNLETALLDSMEDE